MARQVYGFAKAQVATLRFWEKELGEIIIPLRTPGGQRRYKETHISILEQIKHDYSEVVICPDYDLLKQYRSGSKESYDFTKKFAELLFTDQVYKLTNSSNIARLNPQELSDLLTTPTKYINLSNKLCTNKNTALDNEQYIVINTKIRNYKGFNSIKSKFYDFLLKTKSKIVLLGERNLGTNKEALHNNIFTIYKDLKSLPIDYIDLTKEVLLDFPDINNLQQDLNIMKNAVLNINFGVSGTVMLSAAVSNVMGGIIDSEEGFITNFLSNMGENRLVTNNQNEFMNFLIRKGCPKI